MNRNKLLLLVLPFILVGMSFTGCGESTKEKTGSSKAKVESPKEKAMGLLDDLEQAIRDRDDVRAEEISAELEKIDIESFSEEDQKELMEKSVEIMGAAFEEAGDRRRTCSICREVLQTDGTYEWCINENNHWMLD